MHVASSNIVKMLVTELAWTGNDKIKQIFNLSPLKRAHSLVGQTFLR